MSRVAIVAALERELRPFVERWQVSEKEYAGRSLRFYENDDVVAVAGGVGAEAARRAAEAAIALYAPEIIYSVGFAGALEPRLKVGDVVQPAQLIDAADASRVNLPYGDGVLVSYASVATPAQKAQLRESFGAHAVDMEAAAVARAADARAVSFAVVKAISDESDFDFPAMDRFVDNQGRFSEVRLAAFAALRPWLWPRLARLARNSRLASSALSEWLRASLNRSGSDPVRAGAQAPQAVNRR